MPPAGGCPWLILPEGGWAWSLGGCPWALGAVPLLPPEGGAGGVLLPWESPEGACGWALLVVEPVFVELAELFSARAAVGIIESVSAPVTTATPIWRRSLSPSKATGRAAVSFSYCERLLVVVVVMDLTLPFDVLVSDRLRGTLSNAGDAVVLDGAMSRAWHKLLPLLKSFDKGSEMQSSTLCHVARFPPKALQEVCALLVPKLWPVFRWTSARPKRWYSV